MYVLFLVHFYRLGFSIKQHVFYFLIYHVYAFLLCDLIYLFYDWLNQDLFLLLTFWFLYLVNFNHFEIVCFLGLLNHFQCVNDFDFYYLLNLFRYFNLFDFFSANHHVTLGPNFKFILYVNVFWLNFKILISNFKFFTLQFLFQIIFWHVQFVLR